MLALLLLLRLPCPTANEDPTLLGGLLGVAGVCAPLPGGVPLGLGGGGGMPLLLTEGGGGGIFFSGGGVAG